MHFISPKAVLATCSPAFTILTHIWLLIQLIQNLKSLFHIVVHNISHQVSVQLYNLNCSLKWILLWIVLTAHGISPQFLVNSYHTGNDKVIPVHTRKAYRGSGGIFALILDLGTRWSCP